MQLYKVKLNEPSAYPKDSVDGYLGNCFDSGEIELYTRGEAIKKAGMFNGKIEKHGKDFTINKVSICQLFLSQIHPAIIKELDGRHTMKDEELDEHIYSADVFDAILGEQAEIAEVLQYSKEVLDEIFVLSKVTGDFEYIMITRPIS